MERMNERGEIKLVDIHFKIPTYLKVFIIIGQVSMIVYSVVMMIVALVQGSVMYLIPILGGMFAFLILEYLYLRYVRQLAKSYCVITNKRIYGYNQLVFSNKNYSYRLDKINNIEAKSILMIRKLVIQFTQGELITSSNVYYSEAQLGMMRSKHKLSLSFVDNQFEVYRKLTALENLYKNDTACIIENLK